MHHNRINRRWIMIDPNVPGYPGLEPLQTGEENGKRIM